MTERSQQFTLALLDVSARFSTVSGAVGAVELPLSRRVHLVRGVRLRIRSDEIQSRRGCAQPRARADASADASPPQGDGRRLAAAKARDNHKARATHAHNLDVWRLERRAASIFPVLPDFTCAKLMIWLPSRSWRLRCKTLMRM
eukprot:6213672-Pleurochrysis_carterae.AAC.1